MNEVIRQRKTCWFKMASHEGQDEITASDRSDSVKNEVTGFE